MKAKKLWIYLTILLMVGGAWGSIELFFPKKPEEIKIPLLFPNLNPTKITEVQWQRGPEVVDLKKNPSWMILRPLSTPADKQVMDDIVQTLATFRPEGRFSASTKDLKEFGLADPKLKILFLSEGKWMEIQLGEKNAVGTARYGKISNSPDLFLVSDYIFKELDRDLLALRDKRIFSLDLKAIQTLEINGGQKPFILEKASKGWWVKGSPEKRLDKNKIEAFISDLLWMPAKGFAEPDSQDQDHGLKTSHTRITLGAQGKEGREETLILGKEEPGKGLWARSALHKEAVILEANLLKKIPKGPDEWMEKVPSPSPGKGP